MKTLLILCLAILGLAGFTSTKASAAETLPAVVHENAVVIIDADGHRHYRRYHHHYYHHRRYYYRHHRRYYY